MEEDIKKQKKKKRLFSNKVKKYLFKTLFLLFIFLLLLSLFITLYTIFYKKKFEMESNITSLKKENDDILIKIKNVEERFRIAEKYIKIWNEKFTQEQKELKGIDMPYLEKKIKDLAEINFFTNLSINHSQLIIASSAFEKTIVKTYTTLFIIKFSSITDINVYKFIDDIKEKLGYDIVIEDLSMKRTKRVDDGLLKTLKSGTIDPIIDGEIKLRIYGLGMK